MSEAGILVKGMDMRGHGRTYWRNVFASKLTNLQGYTGSFEAIYKDMNQLYERPVEGIDFLLDLPTFVFGHSFGGLLSICYTHLFAASMRNFKGTISQGIQSFQIILFVAPAFAPAKAPPVILKWIARNLGHFIPTHVSD